MTTVQYDFSEMQISGEGLMARGTATLENDYEDDGWHGKCHRWISNVALKFERDECLVWPFYIMKNGYGSVYNRGKPTSAHRVVCEAAHGSPDEIGLQAAHSCGNRVCVNPRHLRWSSRLDNEQDKRSHGTYHLNKARAKLSVSEVKRIREIGRSQPRKEVARMFGVSPPTITDILLRRSWKEYPES